MLLKSIFINIREINILMNNVNKDFIISVGMYMNSLDIRVLFFNDNRIKKLNKIKELVINKSNQSELVLWDLLGTVVGFV